MLYFFTFAQIVLLIMELLLAGLVGYLLVLTVSAWRAARRQMPEPGQPAKRFAVLIPAHNEERLLPDLLQNLAQLDYPHELFTVHVVADNCTDQTAVIARQFGAVAHERFNTAEVGKGYALQWLLQRIWASGEPHDAIVILDADTVVSANFLRAMSGRLARGERVIQAYYAVRNPAHSREKRARRAIRPCLSAARCSHGTSYSPFFGDGRVERAVFGGQPAAACIVAHHGNGNGRVGCQSSAHQLVFSRRAYRRAAHLLTFRPAAGPRAQKCLYGLAQHPCLCHLESVALWARIARLRFTWLDTNGAERRGITCN